MSFIYFIKLLVKNLHWLLIIPVTLALSIFYFTRHERKVYTSESTIYTGIASGYSLSGNNKADFFATSNAFDNLLSLINSRQTRQEVVIELLARHLMIKKHDPALLSWESFDELRKLVPDSIRNMLVKPTVEETVSALNQYMKGGEDNVVYEIVNSENPYYSLDAMENIKALRINNSDLIKISYQTNDAVICRETLEVLEARFMNKHRLLKEGQSESVVTYFEIETKGAFQRLNNAEQAFLEFNRDNDIINYYEQTKAVAVEKENLDVQKQNMQMDNMASKKSLDLVNDNIKGRLYQNEYGTAILKDKEVLSDLYNKIAVEDLLGKKNPNHAAQMDSLRNQSLALEKKLDASVNNLYAETLTPNGIPTKNVLDEWLKTSLSVEQSKARLAVIGERREEFEKQYRKYAPLGATLKKIERQINVSEQEYLELLHGLNLAKLTQQNNELTTKLNVVDEPFVPLKANPSKRLVQVAVAFLMGFVLVLSTILARALINKTVQRPDKARSLIKIPLFGIYPLLNARPVFIEMANRRMIQELLAAVDLRNKPITIGLVSVQSREGKSTLLEILEKKLTALDYVVISHPWNQHLPVVDNREDVIFVELPALDTLLLTPGMMQRFDYTLLVCRANRVWGTIDSELLKLFTQTTGNKPLLLLNGVHPDFAEEYIGEPAKQRFFLRSFLKRLFRFQFGSRKSFK